ncbi:MAG: TatD family hydrolase, partial [Paracoccaceae bacterium]
MAAIPQIVDSHCHLDFPEFAGDLDQVIARAQSAGVARMISIATRLGDV